MRRKRRTKNLFILLMVSLLILIVVGAYAYKEFGPLMVKDLLIEAGSPMVEVQEFLVNKNKKASYVTDLTTINLNKPGVYPIEIAIEDKIYTASLEVIDTTSPTAITVNNAVIKGESITADQFVKEITDATEVTVSFQTMPDTSIVGKQEVSIVLEDAAANKTLMNAVLTVFDLKNEAIIEAGSEWRIIAGDFLNGENYKVAILTDLTKLDTSKPGSHMIELEVDGQKVNGRIKVTDTKPPTATPVDQEIWIGEEIEAISFVIDIQDVSEVTASYVKEPKFATLGQQEVSIELKDEFGNRSVLTAILTIKEDTEAPVIMGVRDITVYIGETLSYRKDVKVLDNKDKEIKLEIDSSAVNLKKEGTYPVIYTAIDSSGNKTTESCMITVMPLSVDLDALNQLLDDILSRITDDSMGQKEIAKEIYSWTKGHIAYTGNSDKTDWMAEAYRGITKGVGDCFTYFAVSQALLNRAGIDNIPLTREGGRTRHYWSLINCGEGWYHFDSTPHKDHHESFYLTETEVEELTELRGNHYYIYDKSLITVTPVQ
ncbi:MAG: transglutaminase [Clostridiales bacterium]|jgi:hypothetical protein|nr:transglutaminase [Clostridiales bacterium]